MSLIQLVWHTQYWVRGAGKEGVPVGGKGGAVLFKKREKGKKSNDENRIKTKKEQHDWKNKNVG